MTSLVSVTNFFSPLSHHCLLFMLFLLSQIFLLKKLLRFFTTINHMKSQRLGEKLCDLLFTPKTQQWLATSTSSKSN